MTSGSPFRVLHALPLAAALAAALACGPAHADEDGAANALGDGWAWAAMAERAEVQLGGEGEFLWDGRAWIGDGDRRLWFETEGQVELDSGEAEEAALKLAYGLPLTPHFDLQAGTRYDFSPRGRTSAMIGLQGVTPWGLEVDLEAYLDHHGDLAADLEVEYDLKLTDRLFLQPRIDAEVALQDSEARELGAGVTELEAGLRLHYEPTPGLAPYVGAVWHGPVGETARIARAEGEETGGPAALVGVRMRF